MEDKGIILTCSECGFTEEDSASRVLMTKVRMFNHVSVEHPARIDQFREIVEEPLKSGRAARITTLRG